jgi:hypothetical protein
MPGRGPAPDDTRARTAWRQAARAVTQIQRRLGHDVDRGLDRGAGLEL